MNDFKPIRTDRLLLRPMRAEDAEYIVKWRNDPDIRKWMFDRECLTIDEHLDWFKNREENRYDCVFCDLESEKPIGTLNFNVDADSLKAEGGKLLGDKKYRRKGLAKESFVAWLDFGFNKLNLKEVYVNTKVINVPNINLNIKIGFMIEKIYEQKIDGNIEKYFKMNLYHERFNEVLKIDG